MSAYAKALSLLTVVTVVTYAVLVGLGMTHLVVGPEDLQPFDLRFFGYHVYDVRIYLDYLSPEAADLYLGPLRVLDTVFPILMGLWLGWAWWGVTDNVHPWSRLIMLTAPGAYTMMDLAENALVAEIVRGRAAPLNQELVALASSYTVSKFVTFGVAIVVLSVVAFRRLRRRAG